MSTSFAEEQTQCCALLEQMPRHPASLCKGEEFSIKIMSKWCNGIQDILRSFSWNKPLTTVNIRYLTAHPTQAINKPHTLAVLVNNDH